MIVYVGGVMQELPSIDAVRLSEKLSRFTSFVQLMDGKDGTISFRDTVGFLGREESYKTLVAEEARNALQIEKWEESWIGTGKIAACAAKAMGVKNNNLVDKHQQTEFRDRIDPNNPKYREEAERTLYDIYRNPACKDMDAFNEAIQTFGAKYDIIAFLFFIKDDTRFLPISTTNFDQGFEELNIPYVTSRKCSWENYQGYLSIIDQIRVFIEEQLPASGQIRLIDAHSFIWIIQQDRFKKWQPNKEQLSKIEQGTESSLQGTIEGKGGIKRTITKAYIRSTQVAEVTKKRARGICQFCNQPAPFNDSKGNPYLEAHHIIWLSRGGEDNTANTVALCPNCHTRMHVLDLPEDIELLQKKIAD